MIEAHGLTKRYGSTVAVDDLSFRVESGRVTGFLGPNGAGKSTTMRMVLGLDRCDAGGVRIDDKRMVDFNPAMHSIGALLDAGYVHPTRKAKDHLWALAVSNGLPHRRVDEVLDLVGLTDKANKRVGAFSLGMKQRLGLAGAMLGDPHTLLFDEPNNGLDPEGIQWMRRFMQGLAAEGRTVFVSSHLLSEMSLVSQDLVVIGRGKLIFQGPVGEFMSDSATTWVTVRSPQVAKLAKALHDQGATITPVASDPNAVDVEGPDSVHIGELAAQMGVTLHELSPHTSSLEDAFLEVTAGAQEYRAGGTAPHPPPPPLPPPPTDGPAQGGSTGGGSR